MLDAVLVGEGLDAVADLAAAESGGSGGLVVPRLGVASRPRATSAGGAGRAAPLRASSAAAAGSAPVPEGVVAEVPIATATSCSARSCCSATPRAGDARSSACGSCAVAALTEVALAQAPATCPTRARRLTLLYALASGAELSREEVRRAARGGCDLRGGAVALCASCTSSARATWSRSCATTGPARWRST